MPQVLLRKTCKMPTSSRKLALRRIRLVIARSPKDDVAIQRKDIHFLDCFATLAMSRTLRVLTKFCYAKLADYGFLRLRLAMRRIRLVIAALDAAISLPKNNLPYLTIILNLVLRKLLQNCLCSNIYLPDFEFLRQ